jgi:hypothetical protein
MEFARTDDRETAWRKIRPKCRSSASADRGARNLLRDPEVQDYVKQAKEQVEANIAKINQHLTVCDPEQMKVVKTIGLTEVGLIAEYIQAALLDPLHYYDENGIAVPLHKLAPEQRRQIKTIDFYPEDENGKRKVKDYVLFDSMAARSELARIMGLTHTGFDFAGFVALITGKTIEETKEDIRKLDHFQGTDFSKIKEKAGLIIEGEVSGRPN